MSFHVPERYRVTKGPLASSADDGNNGAFMVPQARGGPPMCVIASDGGGWEHVSVSLPDRTPNWKQMCQIKDLFWDDGDVVVQFHVPSGDHVNNHLYCLHLWRPLAADLPRPPAWMVGDRSLGTLPIPR